jgi:adenine deaminase
MPNDRQGLIKVALGEAEADLAIINGAVVNVYTGEVEKASVLAKGERIAYVGNDVQKAIGSKTKVIDAAGKTLIPGLIDGHTHIDVLYTVSELLRFAIQGGTTTIITESCTIATTLGYDGIIHFLNSTRRQPVKIFITAPPMVTISPVTEANAIGVKELRRLFRHREIIGLGEPYWADVVGGNQRVLDLIAETIRLSGKVDGHSAGASGKKLQAYVSSGVTSCHEPTTAEEVLERLKLGLFILIREGEVRRELEAVAPIKDSGIPLNRLAVSTDGVGPAQLVNEGYMEVLVQKAIDLGFDPVLAVQMATINVAQHFAMDDIIGGIAPGKYADIVVIPNLKTIKAEYVISNGRVVAQNGRALVSPRKHRYPPSLHNSLRLDKDFSAEDFAIPVEGGRKEVKVRLMDQVTDLLVREEFVDVPVSNGELKADVGKDILKVAAIERAFGTGKKFVGLIRGIGLKRGAIATSSVWDCSDLITVGADEADMARAVNRIRELDGGTVIYAGGKVIAEMALPVAGEISPEPMEAIAAHLGRIQKAAEGLGAKSSDIRLTMSVLPTPAIPFLRICESGLFNLRENRFVELIVG